MNNFQSYALTKFAKGKEKKTRRSDQKCVIYTRVSSQEQAGNTSLQTQVDSCRSFAEENGFHILAEFGGTYESAKSDSDRKEFQRMLEFLKRSRQATKIIVYSLDRFSRTGGGAISIIENLKSRGIDVIAVTQPADTNTATGKLMQQINLIFSNFDNSLRRQKTVGGMIAKMRQGYYCGIAPVGYLNAKVEGVKTIIPDPKTAKYIKLAFKWKAEEGITNAEVQRRLKARGFSIATQTLCRALKTTLYCGLISHNLLEGELIEGKFKALITQERFLKANQVNAKYNKRNSNDPNTPQVALKRFIKCEKCGELLRGYIVKKKGIWYYKCPTVGCKVNRNAEKLHDLFLAELAQFSVPKHLLPKVEASFKEKVRGYFEGQAQEIEGLKSHLSKVEANLEKLETKFLFDEIESEIYHKHRAKIEQEKEKIMEEMARTAKVRSNLDEFTQKAVLMASQLVSLWKSGDYKTRQKLQKIVFPEGVQYDRQKDKCRTFRVNSIFDLLSPKRSILGKKEAVNSAENGENYRSVP